MYGVAVVGVYSRSSDYTIAILSIAIGLFIIYPAYLTFQRYRRLRQIKLRRVTSMYTLPIAMSPVEFSYIFSTKVARQQLYATLYDLANKGVVRLYQVSGQEMVEMGPRIGQVTSFERLLLNYIARSKSASSVKNILQGFTNYELSSGKHIQGSRNYVFWWLLRENLRTRGIIEKRMTGKYTKLVLYYGFLASFILSVVPLFIIRFMQMVNFGEIDLGGLESTLKNGLLFGVIIFLPTIIVSFFLLRLSGKMLGRRWIVTPEFRRYLGQIDAYREFVRLSCKNSLEYSDSELKKEAIRKTKPYAIALGYIKGC